MRIFACIVFVAGVLTACSPGSGEGLDASGRPIGEAPDPGDEPTLPNIQARVFTPICVQCHVGASAPEGLRLDEANAFGDLVGVPSQQVSSLNRVQPSDSANSYLYQKIIGSASVGGQMPLGGPPLPSEDIELIRQWIDNGASPTAVSKPGILASAQIDPNDAHLTIRLAFSSTIDVTSVLPTSFSIQGDNSSASIDTARIVVDNPYALDLVIAGAATGTTIVRVNDGGTTTLLDLSGQPIEPAQLLITGGELLW